MSNGNIVLQAEILIFNLYDDMCPSVYFYQYVLQIDFCSSSTYIN